MSENLTRIRKGILFEAVAIGIVFLAALLPRISSLTIGLTYDENVWISCGVRFIRAIEKLDFQKTLVSYHPGVTTAWIGGIALKLRSVFFSGHTWMSDLRIARFGVALVTSIMILVMYFLMRKLFNRTIAFLGALLMALSPYYIAECSRIHTDALLAGFMLSSVLSFLIYLEKDRRPFYSILSGVFCGLACLTKTNAFFLFPFILVTLLLHHWMRDRKTIPLRFHIRLFLGWTATSLLALCILWPWTWVAAASVGKYRIPAFPFLFPLLLSICYWGIIRRPGLGEKLFSAGNVYSVSMWTVAILLFIGLVVSVWVANPYPLRVARRFFSQPHGYPSVFLKELRNDPGPFLPTFGAIMRTPLLTLALALLSVIYLFRGKGSKEFRWSLLALWLYVILFDVSVSIPAKKGVRYIMPILPAMDILAAFALYHLVKDLLGNRRIWTFIHRKTSSFRWVANTTALSLFIYSIPVLYQLGSGLNVAPYYRTYYSSLSYIWGGRAKVPTIMGVGQGEGMSKVREYLYSSSEQEDAEPLFSLGLEFQDDLDGGLLFSLGLEFQDDLDTGSMISVGLMSRSDSDIPDIPEELRQRFAEHGVSLPDDAETLIEETGSRWIIYLIGDREEAYIIEKRGNELDIYDKRIPERLRQEFKNNGVVLPPEVTVSIEEEGKEWLITNRREGARSSLRLGLGEYHVFWYTVKEKEGRLNVYGAEYIILSVTAAYVGNHPEDVMRYWVNEIPEHVVTLAGIEYAWIYKNKEEEYRLRTLPRFLPENYRVKTMLRFLPGE